MWDPKTISSLQLAARTNNEDAYWAFAKHANEVSTKQSSLRGLLKFKSKNDPISLDEVESEKEIVKRFATGAMSLGSISTESHESLAIAMNQLGENRILEKEVKILLDSSQMNQEFLRDQQSNKWLQVDSV